MDLDNLKSSWKVLDENLDKTQIISNQQIENIITKKIETTLDKEKKFRRFIFIYTLVVFSLFDLFFFIQTSVLQGLLFGIASFAIIINHFSSYKFSKGLIISDITPSDVLLSIEKYKIKKRRSFFWFIPLIIFFDYILSMNGFLGGTAMSIMVILQTIVFIVTLRRLIKKYKYLKSNLKELLELPNEK